VFDVWGVGGGLGGGGGGCWGGGGGGGGWGGEGGGGGRKVSTQEVSQHLVFKEMDSNRFSLLTRL